TGIVLMIITYTIYVTGLLPAHVDMDVVAQNWGKGVTEYMHITGSPSGWTWLTMLGSGDFINFLGLAMLALLTIVCYFILLPGYIRRKNYIYASIVVAEVLVLSLAASGLLGSGGH
ncbi:MAG: DUF1634 domain-containing protein, partial [Proteobacteria bacterium]|nr:DUF1634 domain-containing protein [Pseudomonadota bacterium]